MHVNKKKEPGSKQPDRRGEVKIGGKLYDISGWIKEGKSGPWLSMNVQPREDRPSKSEEPPADDIKDDIPF